MNIIDKLLGRKKRTANVIAEEIANQRGMIAASRARCAEAQHDRKAAIESLDAGRHRAADEKIAEEGREIERREHAVEVLETAHTEQVAIENRQALDREIAEAERESDALSDRMQAEYEPAAIALAAIVRDLRAHYAKRDRLAARAKVLGAPFDGCRPESFRRGLPPSWTATWSNPGPEGGVMQGCPEDAPAGSIKWVDGEPVSKREDVEIRFRRAAELPKSLTTAIGALPALHMDQPDHHAASLENDPHTRKDRARDSVAPSCGFANADRILGLLTPEWHRSEA